MSTSVLSPKKLLALSVAAGLSFAMAPLTQASAATVTKNFSSSCRTNGAPMKYNVTRGQQVSMVISGPDSVTPGETVVVSVQINPEKVPGKESIATMKQLRDVVFRVTLDDPSAFVTAALVGSGRSVSGSPKVSLVGGSMLVMSGMNADINGQDTEWAPPELQITFKVPEGATSLPSVHPAVEGASGEFNNPANFFTAKTVTESILGELTIQLNCQALSGSDTMMSIPVKGADPSKKDDKKKDDKKSTAKKDDKKSTAKKDDAKKDGTTSAAASTDASGLEVVDEDPTTEPLMKSKTPGGLIAIIVIACVAVVGGAGYGIWRARNKKKSGE